MNVLKCRPAVMDLLLIDHFLVSSPTYDDEFLKTFAEICAIKNMYLFAHGSN